MKKDLFPVTSQNSQKYSYCQQTRQLIEKTSPLENLESVSTSGGIEVSLPIAKLLSTLPSKANILKSLYS